MARRPSVHFADKHDQTILLTVSRLSARCVVEKSAGVFGINNMSGISVGINLSLSLPLFLLYTP